MRQLLDLTISASLSGISITCNQFGVNLQLPSVKFLQCEAILHSCLRSSSNDASTALWKITSHSVHVEYDSYKNTKHVLKMIRQ